MNDYTETDKAVTFFAKMMTTSSAFFYALIKFNSINDITVFPKILPDNLVNYCDILLF